MKLSGHLLAAIPLAGGIHMASGSWVAVTLAVLSSVLIDLDHVPDYVILRRGWRGIRDFFDTCNNGELTKTYLVFHAWEWPLAGVLLILSGIGNGLLWPIVLAISYHLVLDTLTNPVKPGFYWITNRARAGFEFALFFQGDTCSEREALERCHGTERTTN
jgi:hypothetical protein